MNPENQEEAAAEKPLLSAAGSRSGGSISGAIFNVSTGMVGAGIMSVPATFKVLGVIPSLFAILVVAYFVEVTVDFLLKFTISGETDSYGGLMAESFGRFGSLALQICVLITNLGALIIYLIIIGDVLSGNDSDGKWHLGVLQEWFGIHWWTSRPFSVLVVVLCVMLPLLCLRRIDSLRHASAISILLAVLFVAVCSGMALYSLWKGGDRKFKFIQSEQNFGRPSDMTSAVRISLVLCVAIYFAVGFFGYLLFGDTIMADMLVNFDQKSDSFIHSLLNTIVRLSYAVHLMLVFPIMNYSLRVNVNELLFPKGPLLSTKTARFLTLTGVLLGFMYVAAISIPNIWYFFQFMGTTTVMCIMFIFPSLIILRDVHKTCTKQDKMLAVLVIVFAVGTSVTAIYSNVSTYIIKK